MQNNTPLNTIPIENFIKLIKAADAKRDREIRLSIQDAKNLTYVLTLLLADLYNKKIKDKESTQEEIISITVDGGKGW
jgi:hypothetical protein